MKQWTGYIAGLLLLAPIVAQADGLIATRAEMMEMLGTYKTDDFETLDLVENGTLNTGLTLIDETSMVYGQGPNLVQDGAVYSSIRGPLTWVGGNYLGLGATKTLIAWNQTASAEPQVFFAITIKYDTPVQAFGLDVLRYGEVGQITVEIYDTNNAFGEEHYLPTLDPGEKMFFGFWREAGITDVVVKNTLFGTIWSPNIDDHTYGMLGATPTVPTTWGRVKRLYR